MSALETELARVAAKHSLPATKSNRQDGEVVATSTARATVLVGGQAHTVSTNTLPRDVTDGDTVTVEWGSAIPTAVAVRTPGAAPGPTNVSGQAVIGMGGTVVQTESVSFGTTFSAAPRVFLTLRNDAPDATISAESATTTGFTLRMRFPSSNSGTYYINWLAIPA